MSGPNIAEKTYLVAVSCYFVAVLFGVFGDARVTLKCSPDCVEGDRDVMLLEELHDPPDGCPGSIVELRFCCLSMKSDKTVSSTETKARHTGSRRPFSAASCNAIHQYRD
jgi:hypothetical protein